MNFKIDENMPVEAADDLRQAGHDAVTVSDQQLAGQPDIRVADVCKAEGRAGLRQGRPTAVSAGRAQSQST